MEVCCEASMAVKILHCRGCTTVEQRLASEVKLIINAALQQGPCNVLKLEW